MSDNQVSTTVQSDSKDFSYDPQRMLNKAGQIQDKLMDAVLGMEAKDLLENPKVMEGVNALLSNVNSTGTAVIRNSLVESNANLGAMADAVIERMESKGLSLIKTVDNTGVRGTIPVDDDIEDGDFEEIQEDMLVRGIVTTNYDEFAKTHNLKTE